MNKIKIHEDIIYNKNVYKDIKIIHLADIHFNVNMKEKRLKILSNSINMEKADYVIITGDVVDTGKIVNNREKMQELFSFFKKIAKENKIIISLGNHDIKVDSRSFFSELNKIKNIYVLDNDIYQDDSVYICGFTLPNVYFYNETGDELEQEFISFLDGHTNLTKGLPKNKIKIALIHSPLRITNKEILSRISNYDIILSGHTHDGMVFDLLKYLFRGNGGIVSPYKKLFPKFVRGRKDINILGKEIVIIITGGVTKLSLVSAKWLSKFNFVYNMGINRILLKGKR